MLGAKERRQNDAQRDLALAHTIAVFSRVTKLQPLAYYLPRPPSDLGSMLGRLKAIAEATGGRIVEGVDAEAGALD